MKRKLIFAQKVAACDIKRVGMEIKTVEKLLPYLESYNTFETINNIVGICNDQLMTWIDKIKIFLIRCSDCSTKYYIFSQKLTKVLLQKLFTWMPFKKANQNISNQQTSKNVNRIPQSAP